MGGLLSYLAGEGRSNEHAEPHLVNGDSTTFTFFGDSELAPSTALAIAWTWRSLVALAITKKSVNEVTGSRCRTRTFSALVS